MSKISIKGNASGTGVFSIEAPNSNSDILLVLPNVAGTLVNDATLNTAFNVTGSAPKYACRAWVNFNGTGTVAIRASGNVSSITDNGVGKYRVNIISSVPDVNYCVVANKTNTATNNGAYIFEDIALRTTTSFRIETGENNAAVDSPNISVALFR